MEPCTRRSTSCGPPPTFTGPIMDAYSYAAPHRQIVGVIHYGMAWEVGISEYGCYYRLSMLAGANNQWFLHILMQNMRLLFDAVDTRERSHVLPLMLLRWHPYYSQTSSPNGSDVLQIGSATSLPCTGLSDGVVVSPKSVFYCKICSSSSMGYECIGGPHVFRITVRQPPQML